MIDLRSDTVTKPSEAMRRAMAEADVGDDVYGEDPTANRLRKVVAERLGKEDALFVPSGVMGNQILLNALTSPSDEVICERHAHIFHYESGTPAAFSGIQLYPVEGKRGVITPEQVEPMIRPESAYYMPRTRVVAVENTHNRAGGGVWTLDEIAALGKLCAQRGLYYHLDGARIWNAATATGATPAEIASEFDTVSACFSKGLGAPVGSAIAGDKAVIAEAFRVRKAMGGGMRQIGVLAAAALHALENNVDRLAEDHERARRLADALANLDGAELVYDETPTNIVLFRTPGVDTTTAIERCRERGLLISQGTVDSLRLVAHLDVGDEEIDEAISILEALFGESS